MIPWALWDDHETTVEITTEVPPRYTVRCSCSWSADAESAVGLHNLATAHFEDVLAARRGHSKV